MTEIRKTVVADRFYPGNALALKKQISSFINLEKENRKAIGVILPHAGYMYSGQVAAQTLNQIELKDNIILLGPNHTGMGLPFSIMVDGIWQTPLGDVKINSVLAKAILKSNNYLKEDSLAHLNEHSLEVELPLLQYFKKDFKIVPIAFSSNNVKILEDIGKSIAQVITKLELQDNVTLLASSDMTHYEPADIVKEKDSKAIEAIIELNGQNLLDRINKYDITMCGYAPTIVLLAAARNLAAKKAELVSYATSGDISGDNSSVVGYAGLIIN